MRLLADENFPGIVVEALRSRGHDVPWIRTETPGIRDPLVVERARREGRILLTFDKDFGELVFRTRLAPPPGIVLLRLPLLTPTELAHVIVTALESRADWVGHFSVVERSRIRMTPLPKVEGIDDPEAGSK